MFDRWIEDGLLDVVGEQGIGAIVFSPLAQGLLTDKYLKGIPEGSRASKKGTYLHKDDLTDEKLDKVKAMNGIAQQRNQTLAQMALVWLLRDERVTSVLIGASSVAQLKENLQALDGLSFTDDELEDIEKILNPKS
jgi:L-glyceraldehyde 3-phosphate reductase